MTRLLSRWSRRGLLLLVGLHALTNIIRAGLALRQAVSLPELPVSLPPLLLAAFGALWALVFAGCAAGIWLQRSAAARVTIYAAVAYQSSYWLIQLAFAQADFWPRAGFVALWSALALLATTMAALAWQRSARTEQPFA